MKTKGKGNVNVRGTAKGKKGSKTVAKHKDVEVPSVQEPCAMLGVTLGYSMSKNYQSVKMDVHVSIPWDPEDIEGGLARAHEEADKYLADHAKELDDALESLAG